MEEEKVNGLKLENCISLNTLPTQTSSLNTSPHVTHSLSLMLTAPSHLSHTLILTFLSFSPPPCPTPYLTHTVVYQLLKAGGRELLDELCLSKQC